MSLARKIRNIFRLALADYFHEWQMSICFVLALAAVLAPMMILFALKFGIIGSMMEQLIQDPRNREIRPVGSNHYGPEWFKVVKAKPEVGFVIPRTRSLAATMQLKSDNAKRILSAELIPTAAGEPLFKKGMQIPTGFHEVVLSKSAARKLKVAVGDTVSGSLSRRYQEKSERVHLDFKVVGVSHLAAFARDGAFTSLDLVIAAEDFRDGRAVAELDWQGGAPLEGPRNFPGFRLYASSVDYVAPLRDGLITSGVEVRTRAADIDIVQTMEQRLNTVFWFVAVIGLTGFSFSMGANLWANVDRKQKDLSVLRLVGYRTGDIVWFPVLQALLTGILGWALASGVYIGVETSVNNMLIAQTEDGNPVCRLLPIHFWIALAFTVGSAVLAAALGGYRAARIQPSDGLREI
ncbi:hypothetical protein MNBD_GAMMA26-949 [hydrothermal vent metagenome]|uniref:ABC3 transporter permease C-terminal domain-containing protein n=1 Tax=hydrothermal vent metagenome TaxID=652676 RepID=A0A3B1B7A1_9ZZZZ